jgi:hypothetical protein
LKRWRGVLVAVAAVIWFAIWIVVPDRLGAGLALFFCGVAGAGFLLYPQPAMKWVRRANPELDQWMSWIPRAIGLFLVTFAVAIAISLLRA